MGVSSQCGEGRVEAAILSPPSLTLPLDGGGNRLVPSPLWGGLGWGAYYPWANCVSWRKSFIIAPDFLKSLEGGH